jgi:hypothetical protein
MHVNTQFCKMVLGSLLKSVIFRDLFFFMVLTVAQVACKEYVSCEAAATASIARTCSADLRSPGNCPHLPLRSSTSQKLVRKDGFSH